MNRCGIPPKSKLRTHLAVLLAGLVISAGAVVVALARATRTVEALLEREGGPRVIAADAFVRRGYPRGQSLVGQNTLVLVRPRTVERGDRVRGPCVVVISAQSLLAIRLDISVASDPWQLPGTTSSYEMGGPIGGTPITIWTVDDAGKVKRVDSCRVSRFEVRR